MPNFTLTPPFVAQALQVYNPTESVLPRLTLTPPRNDQPLGVFDPGETLLPLYHITPPLVTQLATFYDPRVFQIIQPDEVLKNEVRRTNPRKPAT
jgi:hypothetical protein